MLSAREIHIEVHTERLVGQLFDFAHGRPKIIYADMLKRRQSKTTCVADGCDQCV